MNEEAWRPIIPTGNEDVLSEGFPTQMREAVFGWMQLRVGASRGYVQSAVFVNFQNAARTNLGFKADITLNWVQQVLPHLRKISDTDFTNLLDYLTSTGDFYQGNERHPLDPVLSQGGSAWTVVRWNGHHARLTKRVPDGVREAVASTLTATDAASVKLQEAWVDAYGTNPRGSVAYFHAVVAVEIAVLSVISVGKEDATLANTFSILEAEAPKWRLIFRDNERAPGAKTVAAMLRTLWRGQESRHGRSVYEDATLEEARAAVILAATIIQWFTSGVVLAVES
ncbi:hypothetical protein [Clavibacter michiganensis]|uniref:hypothetical protein n=1 Tax=Clavibacter michiganensis TaxID=28447 RepID=UPI001365AE7B|nr:hypothetical protein [Clavibacter michiganensis]